MFVLQYRARELPPTTTRFMASRTKTGSQRVDIRLGNNDENVIESFHLTRHELEGGVTDVKAYRSVVDYVD